MTINPTEQMAAELSRLRRENEQLQRALYFWLPGVGAFGYEWDDRAAEDAALLTGYTGDLSDTAERRGWIATPPHDPELRCGIELQRKEIDRLRKRAERAEALIAVMREALEDVVKRNEIQHWFNVDKQKAALAAIEPKEGE